MENFDELFIAKLVPLLAVVQEIVTPSRKQCSLLFYVHCNSPEDQKEKNCASVWKYT